MKYLVISTPISPQDRSGQITVFILLDLLTRFPLSNRTGVLSTSGLYTESKQQRVSAISKFQAYLWCHTLVSITFYDGRQKERPPQGAGENKTATRNQTFPANWLAQTKYIPRYLPYHVLPETICLQMQSCSLWNTGIPLWVQLSQPWNRLYDRIRGQRL